MDIRLTVPSVLSISHVHTYYEFIRLKPRRGQVGAVNVTHAATLAVAQRAAKLKVPQS